MLDPAKWRRRILYLFRQRQIEAEIAEELETHRQMATDRALQDGAALPDASAASRRAMGNVTLAREDARAAWIAPWLDSVWQDGMYALRMFRRAPVFTGAFVLVMALGVGATTAVFALVDGLVLRDLPVSRPDRLVYFSAPSFSYPIFTEVQARSTDVLDQCRGLERRGRVRGVDAAAGAVRGADRIRRLLRHARRNGGRRSHLLGRRRPDRRRPRRTCRGDQLLRVAAALRRGSCRRGADRPRRNRTPTPSSASRRAGSSAWPPAWRRRSRFR